MQELMCLWIKTLSHNEVWESATLQCNKHWGASIKGTSFCIQLSEHLLLNMNLTPRGHWSFSPFRIMLYLPRDVINSNKIIEEHGVAIGQFMEIYGRTKSQLALTMEGKVEKPTECNDQLFPLLEAMVCTTVNSRSLCMCLIFLVGLPEILSGSY